MAKNKLLEAAAEILSQSKKSAPAMPMQHLDGQSQVQDLGGPTPQNGKPDDDSEKVDAGKGAKKMPVPATKPSAASGKTVEKLPKEITDSDQVEENTEVVEPVITEEPAAVSYKDDIDALFTGETISEDFRNKVTTIFEARVNDRVKQITEQIEAEQSKMLEEAVATIQEDLATKVNDYLNYVVEEWMKENEIAIEKGLRSELVEDFIGGMRNLFAEHYIDVPADKVDMVEALTEKVEELETKLNESLASAATIKKALDESKKNEVVRQVCEGLTETQVEKVRELAEGVEFTAEDEYKSKLETLRENYFPSTVKKPESSGALMEQADETPVEEKKLDPRMAAYTSAIARSKK